MKSIKTRFEKIQYKNPLNSSFASFAETVKGKNYNHQIILKWFNKLVNKNDYDFREKKDLIKHLDQISKSA